MALLSFKRVAFGFAALIGLALDAGATVIPVTEVFAHNEKANFAGVIGDMINGSGMNGYPDTGNPGWPAGEADPSLWTATANGYTSEWQSGDLLGDGEIGEPVPTNGKIGYAIFNLGAPVAGLDKFYLWNVRENGNRAVKDYNIYYAVNPSVTPVHGPTGNLSIDYDFASGGWTQVGGTASMSFRTTAGAAANAIVDLGGVTARYLAIEILSNGVGATPDTTRTGLAEVGVTATVVIPEPGSLGLLALGGMVLVRLRRR